MNDRSLITESQDGTEDDAREPMAGDAMSDQVRESGRDDRPRPRGKRRRHLLLLLLPVLFALIPAVRYFLSEPEQRAIPLTSVVVQHPFFGEISESLTYSGILEPDSTVAVVPKISAQIVRVHVSEGAAVEAGDLLVTLDSEIVRLQAESAESGWEAAQAQYELALRGARSEELDNSRASLAQAESDLALAQRNLERTRRLYEAETVSRSELENAEAQVEGAETEVENLRRLLRMMSDGAVEEEIDAVRANAVAARRRFELTNVQLSEAEVRSPVTGTVARVPAQEGDTASPSRPVATIISDGFLTSSVAVPERRYGRIRQIGSAMEAVVRPLAYEEDLSFKAEVVRIESTVDPTSRTFAVEIAVDNSEGLLLPGMYATVELVLRSIPDALLVPRSAVLTRNGTTVAFVVTEGESLYARMVEVETGLTRGSLIQVVTGLKSSDQVVVEGNAFLEADQEVRLARR